MCDPCDTVQIGKNKYQCSDCGDIVRVDAAPDSVESAARPIDRGRPQTF